MRITTRDILDTDKWSSAPLFPQSALLRHAPPRVGVSVGIIDSDTDRCIGNININLDGNGKLVIEHEVRDITLTLTEDNKYLPSSPNNFEVLKQTHANQCIMTLIGRRKFLTGAHSLEGRNGYKI